MNELVKSEEASVCRTDLQQSWLDREFTGGPGSKRPWELRLLGRRSSGGAVAGQTQEEEPLGTATGSRLGGSSCPRTRHRGGRCLRVFAGGLLPAHPADAWIPAPSRPPPSGARHPIPALWRPSVCAGAVRPSQAAGGGGVERGRGKGGGGKEERAEATPKVPNLLRRKTAWGVQPRSAWEPEWVGTVYTGHPEGGGGLLRKETFQTRPLGSRGPYLKVRWGLFHFLPVRA